MTQNNDIKTILIIDDNETNINALIDILEDKYDILVSIDGQGALEILAHEVVDLILLDILMPEMDGFEVCKRLKEDFSTENIPIIFITAMQDENSIEQAYKLGGVDYLRKPFNVKEVLSVVNTHIDIKEQREELEKTLQTNASFFEQYQDAVNEATIISKTDIKGRITYVNDEFCKISGFERNELINQNHNIVRHFTTPSNVFKQMWTTIKNKKTWKGVLKNKTKHGTQYIVQTTIKPILDIEGNINEFVAISQDITEIFNLQNEIIETQKEMLERMGELAETRSKETGHHVSRVAKYSALLAKHYGLTNEEVQLLEMASPMHDIGKIAIPDNILLKPGKLEKDEFEIMKTHAEKGYSVFEGSKRELLKVAAIVAHEHHEKWDGSGYPRGLKGEEIHIYGRITALADVFDALGSDRIYKKAWEDERIFELFKNESGKHFDPQLVEIFFKNLDDFLKIREEFKDI